MTRCCGCADLWPLPAVDLPALWRVDCPNMKKEERRVLKRVEAELPIRVVLLDTKRHPIGTEMVGRLQDLSPAGCAFRVPNQLLVGKNVQVSIALNKELAAKYSEQELQAHGPVIRASKDGNDYLVTMRFLIDH